MFTKHFLSTAEIFSETQSMKLAPLADLFTVSGASKQPRHECYFEDEQNSGLPILIIPHNDDEESFFADVATYYPTWSPITAHIHIARSDQVYEKTTHIRTRAKAKGNKRIEKSKLSIWTALAYAEAASLSISHNSSEQEPSYALCRRTLAFSLARANSLYSFVPVSVVADKWSMLHSLISGETNHSLTDTIIFLAAELSNEKNKILDEKFNEILPFIRLQDLTKYQSDDLNISHHLLEFHPSISQLAIELSGNFDRRMEVFQNIVELVRGNPHSELIDTITIAFFGNRILPGSMRYLKVLSRLLSTYQSVLVWYGFFSARSARHASESITVGIDRKLQRDITQYFAYNITPSVDISINELHTLSRIGTNALALRPIQPRSIFVSLLPGITIPVRLGEDSSGSVSKDTEKLRQLRNREKILTALLAEAQNILNNPVGEDNSQLKSSKARYNRDRY